MVDFICCDHCGQMMLCGEEIRVGRQDLCKKCAEKEKEA